ncbi:MAG: glycosyl hydrolase family 28 protein [Prolixibacteraceae bacterium]|nr:glycosyl hydrolase family 28 protein [Prolixibacteraceae bacterium]
MKSSILFVLSIVLLVGCNNQKEAVSNVFPDGTPIPDWFFQTRKVTLDELGEQYVLTNYGVKNDSAIIQTEAIQAVIDEASENGGGVIVVPEGTFMSGALFFKPNTHLHITDNGMLKGSDIIDDYPMMASRMEGQNLDYFPALVNAYGVDGFTISGKGIIDGNGLNFWKAFWQRRKENPQCTNLEVSRPRLVFIWNSNDVQLQDVSLHNAGFWSSHYYKCNNVKILDVHIYSPHAPVKAPSTDAIDIDACTNVLVKGCYMSVNDDAIALKGGKGPWADTDPNNGANMNILIEDCEFGFCHSALTCGSESIHNKNVLMRNCYVNEAKRLFWLKMRPDTPQKYEYITIENIKGNAQNMIYIKPWRQFFDLKGREDVPQSFSENITFRNIELNCEVFFNVAITENDKLSKFTFENLKIETKKDAFNTDLIEDVTLNNIVINGKKLY